MHRDFHKLLQRYLENLGNYMDDWWIATESTPKGVTLYLKIAHEFLDQMKKKSHFLNVFKTKFEEPQMEFLGWVSSQEGSERFLFAQRVSMSH